MRTFPVVIFILALSILAAGACGDDSSTAKATTPEAGSQQPTKPVVAPEAAPTVPAESLTWTGESSTSASGSSRVGSSWGSQTCGHKPDVVNC